MNPEQAFLLCFGDPDLTARIAAYGLPAALFLAGLAGSAMHCLGMCGPFVLGQVAANAEAVGAGPYGEIQRLREGALLPYHLGRLTTYSGLGAVAGLVGRALFALPGLRLVAALMLLFAGLTLAAQAVPRLGRFLPIISAWPGFSRLITRSAGAVAARPRQTLLSLWFFGVLLGFLPCGFLWGALAAAAASGSAPAGAAAMAGFALGTMPILIGLGWGGAMFGRRHPILTRLAMPLQLLNVLFLLWIAARILLLT